MSREAPFDGGRASRSAGATRGGSVLGVTASWLVSAAVTLAVVRIHGQGPGGTGAIVRYLVVVGSILTSLILSVLRFKSRWVRALLVILPGLPILGGISFLTAPAIGYGGQILSFCTRVILAGVAAGGALAALFPRPRVFPRSGGSPLRKEPGVDRPRAGGKVWIAVAIQSVLAAFGIAAFGGAGLLPAVQHHGATGLDCYSLRLESGSLGYPLTVGNSAYLMGESGYLYEVSLDPLRLVAKVELPSPTPAEAGQPGLAEPPDDRAAAPEWGLVAQVDPATLSAEYPYGLGRTTEGAGGRTWGAVGLWHLEATVNLPTRSVVSWHVVEEPTGFDLGYPDPVEVGPYRAVWGDFRDSLHVTGPGVDTRIWPGGQLRWLMAGDSSILAGTDRGKLFVIRLPGAP